MKIDNNNTLKMDYQHRRHPRGLDEARLTYGCFLYTRTMLPDMFEMEVKFNCIYSLKNMFVIIFKVSNNDLFFSRTMML